MKDEISLLQAQLTYKKRLEAMLSELRSQQILLQEKVSRLEANMKLEHRDVQRLEGRGLTAFFYGVTGHREEKLDKERREYYAARVKYEAAVRELKAVEQDLEATVEDLQDLSDCEKRYVQVMEEKRIAIERSGSDLSEKLLEKEEKLSFYHSQEQELEEAIAAGTSALRAANDVVQSMKQAENLGLFDALGAAFLVDMAKHETLDEAQRSVEELQVCLQRFNKELSDVALRADLKVSVERLLKFADTFFEGLILEQSAPEKIQNARTQVDQTRDSILGILRQLQTRLEEVRRKQEKAKAEVDAMIEGAQL